MSRHHHSSKHNDEFSIEAMISRIRAAGPYATDEELMDLATRLCDGDAAMAHIIVTAARLMDKWHETDISIPSNG